MQIDAKWCENIVFTPPCLQGWTLANPDSQQPKYWPQRTGGKCLHYFIVYILRYTQMVTGMPEANCFTALGANCWTVRGLSSMNCSKILFIDIMHVFFECMCVCVVCVSLPYNLLPLPYPISIYLQSQTLKLLLAHPNFLSKVSSLFVNLYPFSLLCEHTGYWKNVHHIIIYFNIINNTIWWQLYYIHRSN